MRNNLSFLSIIQKHVKVMAIYEEKLYIKRIKKGNEKKRMNKEKRKTEEIENGRNKQRRRENQKLTKNPKEQESKFKRERMLLINFLFIT